MNKVYLIGNTTADIELKATKSGTSYCGFTLAVKRNKDITDFIDCEAWSVLAETLAKYVTKGDKVAIAGHLDIYEYEDKTGSKRRLTYVTVDEFEFMQRRRDQAQKPQEQKEPEPQDDVEDEELPF